MQSQNQVIILGISIFEKPEETIQLNHSAGKKDHHPTFCCCFPDFKLYSLLLQCSECVQSKNRVDLVELSIFYKPEKTSGQTVRPIKIKIVRNAFQPYLGRLVVKVVLYALDISSPKLKSLHRKNFSKIGQDGCVKNFC